MCQSSPSCVPISLTYDQNKFQLFLLKETISFHQNLWKTHARSPLMDLWGYFCNGSEVKTFVFIRENNWNLFQHRQKCKKHRKSLISLLKLNIKFQTKLLFRLHFCRSQGHPVFKPSHTGNWVFILNFKMIEKGIIFKSYHDIDQNYLSKSHVF